MSLIDELTFVRECTYCIRPAIIELPLMDDRNGRRDWPYCRRHAIIFEGKQPATECELCIHDAVWQSPAGYHYCSYHKDHH